MSISLDPDPIARIVRVTVRGVLTDDELLVAARRQRRLLAAGTIRDDWIQLVDTSGVESMGAVSTQAIRSIARATVWPDESLWIVIAPSDEMFGLVRMYELHAGASEGRLHVVRTSDEARILIEQARSSGDESIE